MIIVECLKLFNDFKKQRLVNTGAFSIKYIFCKAQDIFVYHCISREERKQNCKSSSPEIRIVPRKGKTTQHQQSLIKTCKNWGLIMSQDDRLI